MKITKKQLNRLKNGTASKKEIEKLIKLSEKEIGEWICFLNRCESLLIKKEKL